MPDDPTNLPPRLEMRSIEHYTTKDFLTWVSHWKPAVPPPAPYKYSNSGIGLLSYLVMNATGKSWEEQLNNEIAKPLGMIDTALRPTPEQQQRLARGHLKNGNKRSGVADLRLVCRRRTTLDRSRHAQLWRS